jgi:hypothetical protein
MCGRVSTEPALRQVQSYGVQGPSAVQLKGEYATTGCNFAIRSKIFRVISIVRWASVLAGSHLGAWRRCRHGVAPLRPARLHPHKAARHGVQRPMPVAVIKTSCRGGGQTRVRRRMRAIRNVSLPSTILASGRQLVAASARATTLSVPAVPSHSSCSSSRAACSKDIIRRGR